MVNDHGMRINGKAYLVLVVLACMAVVFLVYRTHRTPVAPIAYDSNDNGNWDVTLSTGAVFDPDDVVPSVATASATSEGFDEDATSIPAIDEPTFTSVPIADQYLKDDGLGLDVESDGEHRFYPYQILVWHEIVNDEFGSVPIVVTFDPLTFVGAVYERTVSTETLVFQTTGLVWNNNLLMGDSLGASLWIQSIGEGQLGPYSGVVLKTYPATVMAWHDWKSEYPRGDVLSLNTGVERDYTRDPYAEYYDSQAILFPLTTKDARYPLKKLVYGIVEDGKAKAYPAELIDQEQVTLDETLNPTLCYWFLWSTIHPNSEIYLP